MADQENGKKDERVPPKVDLSRQQQPKAPEGQESASGPEPEKAEKEEARLGTPGNPLAINMQDLPKAPKPPSPERRPEKMIRIKLPDVEIPEKKTSPASAQTSEDARAAAKRETSRIPLETASPRPGAHPGKTSRIPQVVEPGPATPAPPRPSARPGKADTAKAVDDVAAAKRQTSRISLEAAFAPEGEEAAGAEGPRAIRIKRPGEAPAEEVKPLSDTARIEHGEADEDDISPTRRKTIRVKRAPMPGASAAEVQEEAEAEAEPAPAAAPQFAMLHPVEERWSWMYPLAAAAAVVVAAIALYILAAQAFPGSNLPWPGRIAGL